MQIIFCIMIYIIGVLLGSFYTLATYRIPRHQDILYTRSYCPKCNHRLEFLDLIPILSYIFLGGKCRYCKDKISPRYIIIETISGIAYLLFILSLGINIYTLTILKVIYIILLTIYFSILILLAGIEKETKEVPKSILNFGLILISIFIVYLYITKTNIYINLLYLLIYIILLIFINKKDNYMMKALQVLILTMFFTNNLAITLIVIGLSIITYILAKKRKVLVFSICTYMLLLTTIINLIEINGWCL